MRRHTLDPETLTVDSFVPVESSDPDQLAANQSVHTTPAIAQTPLILFTATPECTSLYQTTY